MFIFVYCIRSWWSLDAKFSLFWAKKCLGQFTSDFMVCVCGHDPSIQVGTLCLNLGISLLDHKKHSKDEKIGCASLYVQLVFIIIFMSIHLVFFLFLARFCLYMFEMIGGCHVKRRPFTIPPKTVGFSRTGVIHSEILPKQQRDGMQLALLPGWKWSLEKSLVFMGHLKKECLIPDRRLCNGQHFSRNQLLHDKSVGDILGICSTSRLFKGSQKKNISLPEEIWGWPFRNLLVPESGFQRLIPYNSTVFRVNVHWAMLSICGI